MEEIIALSTPDEGDEIKSSEDKLIDKLSGGKGKKYGRFVLAAMSSIPWVGGLIGASASFSAEKDQEKINTFQRLWLEEHKTKMKELGVTLVDIFSRLDGFGEEIQQRIESPEYLTLVKKTFRSWDEADTQEKKQMLKKLITNAGAITLCPDDLVRLFINWINQYHESHFMVVREIYKNPNITRAEIWDKIHPGGIKPREDSPDADLFRYLINDLSLGRVIRQQREKDWQGNFMKKDTRGPKNENPSRTMESAFEGTKPYELSELGKQFVHYVMEDVAPQISGGVKTTQG